MTKAIGTWEEADAMKVHIEVFDENGNQWGGGWDACCSADLFARPDELRQFVAERCQYVPMPKRGACIHRRRCKTWQEISPSLLNRRFDVRTSIKRRRREGFPASFCFS